MSNSSSLPSPYPLPGEIIGDSWKVERILGEGGMGAVARAWDLILHTPVAIKFMNPQFLTFPGAEERFINEGKASALIKSDHVVPVMKAGKTASGTPYLVMECLEGVDLADLIARDGTPGLPTERSVHFLLQVLRALQAAHAIGIIHRDMKPSNCFVVNKDGEEDFVKILDFGISKIQKPGSASLTQTNSALGTPLYMSPEQARSPRDVDARSDLYSVGVIIYELLTGHTPFNSESGEFTEILFKLFTAEPPRVESTRPDLPPELATAVHKALARDVNDRFSSALEMAEALAPFASERSLHVLTRMRAFKAPTNKSILPPEDLPQSMVAFSQIQHGPQTDLMANRPTTDVMKGPPVTEMLPRAGDRTDKGSAKVGGSGTAASPGRPGAGPGPSASDTASGRRGSVAPPTLIDAFIDKNTPGGSSYGARLSTTPAAPEMRARPEEASAKTQYDSQPDRRPAVAGASTDLNNARDASVIEGPPRKRSPLIFALPVLALLGIGGAVLATMKSNTAKTNASVAPPLSDPPTLPSLPVSNANLTVPPASVSVTASAPEPSAKTAPSASVSATVVRTVTRPNPHVDPPTGPGTSVLDTKIHQ